MAYGLYDGSLKSIPGLGGVIQSQEENQATDARNLQNASGVMQLMKAAQDRKDEASIRAALSQGGEPGQVIQRLLQTGSPAGVQLAQHVMTLNQAQQGMDLMKGVDLSNPDALERVATGLSMTGHAAAGPMMNLAKTLRERQANVGEHAAQVSQETPITEAPQMGLRNGALAERSIINGPEPAPGAIPPEVQAAMASGKPFSIGVGQSANPAENVQRTGGLFSQFYNSPISVLPNRAAGQQMALDASNPLSIAPKSWEDKAAAMGTQEGSLANAQAMTGLRVGATERGQDIRSGNQQRGQDMNRENILLRMGQNPDGSLNENGMARAKLIASGKMAATAQDRGIMGTVAQINPNWSNADYQVNLANEKAFGPGKKGDTIRSFSVTVDHLHTLSDLADALDNGDIQVVNRLGNYIASQTGKPAPTDFNAAKGLVADEIVKAVVGAGGALGDRETAQATLNAANSPAQIKGVIDTYERLMSGQLRGLHQQYVASGGTKDFNSFLSEEAKRAAAEHPAGTSVNTKAAGPIRVLNGVTYIKANGQWVQQ